MKFTLIILTVLTPFFAHAGGGGGLRPGMQRMMIVRNPEIVFSMGSNNDSVFFAHGKKIENSWEINKYRISIDALQKDEALLQALSSSEQNNSWTPIQK